MTINIDNFAPSIDIMEDDLTIKKILDFVTKIYNTYNISRYSYGCFYTNWKTLTGKTESVIGRMDMHDFLIKLNSGNNEFSKIVQIYNEIYKLQKLRDDYRQRGLVNCCNYDNMIKELKILL